MTHQNHQTNGASLEDCHTNFFALTELYGIKWRKLVWGETSGGGEGDEGAAPLADPVISSYARCLAGDILCVWRRVPAQPPPSVDIYEMRAPARPPPLSLRAAKELWIFWYGEEPDLNGLVAPELISSQGEQGSWESGLSYECRSLLFKALHNLIERCLLSRDFVRLGKWFVQPYDGDEEDVGKSPWHLSFSFAFFLHGESTVCASVDVRQHPPVRTLTAKRLQRLHAAERQPDAKVILAPFGLEGTLTGREWTDSDPATARLFDAWRQHYPLEQGCGAVEVCCGGARMHYPLPYVLVTEMEAPPASPPAHSLAHRALTALTTPTPHQTPEVCYGDASGDKSEDLVDPTRKTPCTCAKWRRRRLRPPPFHRRTRPHQVQPHRPKAHAHAQAVAGGAVGGCSPGSGSCGGGSPGAGGSAPPSAGPPPHSPHHAHHAHAQHHHSANNSHQSASAVPTTLHTPAPTPDPHAPPTPAPPSLPPPKAYNQGDSPPSGVGANALCASDGGDQPLMELGKPPTLPSAERRLDPLEDEHSLHMLYDYSTVYAWLEHPVKRFKTEEVSFREELALGSSEGDLYAGHEHTSMPATPHHDRRDYKQERHDHDDTKEYKNLFTSDGLCPTFKDLEQIFDNSDDAASGDETVRLLQVSTPPDSNKSGEERERGCMGRMVRAEELSKMFPTPPSMEAHAQPSPGFSLPDDATPLQRHLHLAAGSPSPDTAIEDWSFVFKPPTVFKYVGSSKYAPLATLPSHLLPPVLLPPHAVYRPRRRRDDDLEPDNCRTGVKRSASPASDCRESRSRRSCEVGTGTGPPSRGEAHAHSDEPGSVGRHHARSPSAGREARGGAGAAAAATAQADPLLLNVLLGDTVLNVFRDHNFDSCTLCVCNVSPQVVVGNIRGADASTYLCGWGGGEGAESPLPEEEACRCTCGFSAIVNRRLAYRAGLFLEDEIEITGLSEEPRQSGVGGGGGGGGGGGRGLGEVAGVVVAQCAALSGGRASALARAAAAAARSATNDEQRLNLLEYTDGNTAATRALRAAVGTSMAPNGATGAASAVHRWPFISARAPRSSRDVVRLMRRLRPLLQDAIQKRCCGARMWDGVTGPLTWRQFHRLAGRGNEDLCEPQPVPPLLVGHDRDWISLSPYALRHWERLSLEPYSYARDVAYVVLAADGEALTDPLRTFFRELSNAYESCRLGRHQPINRVARDGIVRTSPADRDANCEEWTGTLPPGRLGEYIKAYAETLRTSLVPQLAALTVDRSLVEEERSTLNERPAPSPMRPPSTPDHPATPTGHSDHEGDNSANNSGCGTSNSSGLGSGAMGSWEEEEGGPPALVVYIVEPPAAHAHRSHALHALLRLAARTYNHLHHHNPLIKIISLESVCSMWGCGGGVGGAGGAAGGWCGEGSEARALAFSVFSGARRLLQHHANGKSLTGFGTAADANLFLQAKDEKNRAPYKLFSPLWVLAAPRARAEAESWAQAGAGAGTGGEGAVLFLAYCLSHDQRWLLAAATDARGELLDTAAINIHVPHRSRRRGGGPARRHGLTKLMDFALGLMSNTAQPWRLVVGRVGRIGHGELKGWNWLLSRKHLERASATLKQICGGCAALYPGGTPCILSACLISTEPDPRLRLMADRFTPDERFSQASIQSHLHTPRDVTATHILVFPTSATTQSNQTTFEPSMANGEDDIFLSVDMGEEEMGEENITDLLVGDMFNIWPTSSPRRHDDDPASPQAQHHHNANYHHQDDHNQEQVGLLLQQPLALGYLVSTAPLDAMPAWWWAQCAHLQGLCPAFLKNALHLHTASAPDEDAFSHPAAQQPASAPHRAARDRTHPLDSQITTDVLRYVLEGYNALSWLTLDGDTHDRLSCLPLHVQVLMQLYHTAAALG